MKNRRFLKSIVLGTILASLSMVAISFSSLSKRSDVKEAGATYNQSVNDYYSNINWDQTGATLKTSLFNKIKITTAGWSYDGLWTAYKTTDVRPDGTHFWDIYSDTTMYTLNDSRINASYKKEGDSINREHVIPQSSFNEAAPMKSDVHHVLPSDGYVNNRRSAYPHGIVTGSPTYTSNDGCKLGSGTGSTTVFEPMDNYKGDIARIYFYFVTCYQDKMSSNSFSAFDKTTHPSIKTAYLNVYLQWAKDDPVSEKEIIRNNAAYAGQGNRNPFIDCPYAVGAIWDPTHASDYGNKGEYTSGTGVSISKTSASLISGGTTTISATSTEGGTINWTTSNSSVVSLSSSTSSSGNNITLTAGNAGSATITASQTISGTTYSKTCSVTVSATKQVASIAISGQKTSYAVDDTFVKPTVTATYNDDTEATVTNDATCSGYNMSVADTYTVTVSYSYGGATKTTTYEITVSSSGGGGGEIEGYTLVTSVSSLSDNDRVVLTTIQTSSPIKGVTGQNGNNDATVSTTEADWVAYVVSSKSNNGFKLYDSSAEKYIASPTSNHFKYDTSGGIVSVDNNGHFVCNNRYLCINSSYYRCYTSIGSYTPFYIYKVNYAAASLTEIGISTFPTKMNYTIGECFDPTGLVISRTYSDSSSDTYAYAGHTTEFTFDPSLVTPLQSGDETIEVTYGGQSCFFEIELTAAKVLSSISISGYTTSFAEGDTFSFGGTVTAHYADASSENVTSSATFSGYNMTTVGNQTVTVTYSGQTQTYGITVSAGTLSSIAVSGQTTSYVKNASFSFDGICTATFENGYEKSVTPTSVTSPDMSTGGSKTITVSYTYNGKTKTTTYTVSVNTYRTVMEESYSLIGTVSYTSGSEAISVNTLSTSKSGYTNIENGPDTSHKAIRLGSGSNKGTLTITSTTSNISKVVVNARTYNTDSPVTITIGGTSNSLTTSYADYTKEYSTATNSVAIATTTNGKRAWIASVTVYTWQNVDIGQSEDCVGLETFVNTYMHMDYTESLGYCSDSEHHYYSTAKAAFNALNTHQRSLFTSNSAYSTEWTRLSTWASFNGESLNSDNLLSESNNIKAIMPTSNINSTLIIVTAIVLGAVTIGGYIYLRKKKENDNE